MYTQKKPIENAHIVRERDRRRFRELLAVLALGVPIGLFLLLFTWQNLEVIRLGREVTRLQNARKELSEDNKRLQFELTGDVRGSLLAWLERRGGTIDDYAFPSRVDRTSHMSTRQYARLVDEWVTAIGLDVPSTAHTHCAGQRLL